jgi:uncharacterized alkaline shock family protein YloU
MALNTSNLYGKIAVTDAAIRTVAGTTALESYGVYGLVGHGVEIQAGKPLKPDSFKKSVRIDTKDNRIYVEINVILKFGVSVDAVAESLRNAIKYNVENFTGMTVECININVLGIKN